MRLAGCEITLGAVLSSPDAPVDSLPHERRPLLNTSSHLRGEFFEAFGADHGRNLLLRSR